MHGCCTVHGRAGVLVMDLMEVFVQPGSVKQPVSVEIVGLVVHK